MYGRRREYRPSNEARRLAYNRATLAALDRDSPAHGRTLRERGEPLGWWHSVDYFRTSGRTPEQTAAALIACDIPETPPTRP